MGWALEIIKVGVGCGLGIFVGSWIAARRTHREQLLTSYTDYFGNVLAVALERDSAGAEKALALLSRTLHRVELLESDGVCIRAAGMLFARCHDLASTLAGGASPTSGAAAERRSVISEEYATALVVVRQRLGFNRNPV